MVFSISYDKTARLWDFDTGECLKVYTGHINNVTSLICVKNVIGVRQSANQNNKNNPNPLQKEKTMREFSPEITKDILITGSLDTTARSWSVQLGKTMHLFKGHSGAVTFICLDKLEKILFTASADHSIKSWELDTGDLLTNFKGHEGPVLCLKYYKNMLYSSSADHTIRSWATEYGECTRIFKEHWHSVPNFVIVEGLCNL